MVCGAGIYSDILNYKIEEKKNHPKNTSVNPVLYESDLYNGEKSTGVTYPPQQDKGSKIKQKGLSGSR